MTTDEENAANYARDGQPMDEQEAAYYARLDEIVTPRELAVRALAAAGLRGQDELSVMATLDAAGLRVDHALATTPTDPAAGGDLAALLSPEDVEALAADLCDRAKRPARTRYHHSSWEAAGRRTIRPEVTERDWWRDHAREVAQWVRDHLATPAAPGAATEGGDRRAGLRPDQVRHSLEVFGDSFTIMESGVGSREDVAHSLAQAARTVDAASPRPAATEGEAASGDFAPVTEREWLAYAQGVRDGRKVEHATNPGLAAPTPSTAATEGGVSS